MALNLAAFAAGVERGGFDNLYSITAARITGLGLSLCLTLLLISPPRRRRAVLGYACALLPLLYGTALTGSRGPLLATVFAAMFVFLFLHSTLKNRLMTVLRLSFVFASLGLLTVATGLNLSDTSSPSLNRIADRFETFGANRSDLGRLDRYQRAWEGIRASGMNGLGTGSFAALYLSEGGSERDYPHNLLLEVGLEQGIVGIVLVALLLSLSYGRTRYLSVRLRHHVGVKALLSLFPYTLFNSLLSADVAGNYPLWIVAALPWFVSASSFTLPKRFGVRRFQVR